MAEFTNAQKAVYAFDVLDGFGNAADIDGAPMSLDSDPSVAVSSVDIGDGKGKWVMTIRGLTASPEGSVQRTTVTVDADLSAGVSDLVGFVEYTVVSDPRTGAKVIQFADPVISDA